MLNYISQVNWECNRKLKINKEMKCGTKILEWFISRTKACCIVGHSWSFKYMLLLKIKSKSHCPLCYVRTVALLVLPDYGCCCVCICDVSIMCTTVTVIQTFVCWLDFQIMNFFFCSCYFLVVNSIASKVVNSIASKVWSLMGRGII